MTRILIVDDNLENRYMLRVLLEGNGCEVEEARNGAEALEKARARIPDLIVSDLLMPVMDGYTLLRHWRSDEQLKKRPFVVYTATYTDPRDERLARDLGADAFLLKPAEPEPFMECLTEVLDRSKRGEFQTVATPAPEEHRLLSEYNEALVRKLEKRAIQLEKANRELREEVEERRRAEEALRLRDRAIQAVSQGILITDYSPPDHPIIFASAGFERITGYSAAEIMGKNCRFLQGKDTDQSTVQELREAIAEGRSCSVELLNYRKDGSAFWNLLSISPVLAPDGQISHYVGVQTDITERRRLEEQYRQSQKLEAVGKLAGGVAHDFNNLLTVINGYSDIVLRQLGANDPNRELLGEVNKAGERAAGLTRQLLAFSRQQMLTPKVLNLNSVIAETERLLRRLIGEDVILETNLASALGWVKADPGQIEQVLMNLAVNARDAMPRGGRLTIETQMVTLDEVACRSMDDMPPGTYVLMAVSDTGEGMDAATRARIFEPFFTTKEPGQGTGLGLATVHGIVKQSRGHITVYSEVGIGTTFKVYLPVIQPLPVPVRPGVSAQGMPLGSETVLLVEDEEAVRALASHILRECGYRVLEAFDGKEAIRVIENETGVIDLMISDVVMPHLGGRALAEQVARLRPKCKVLFLSGYTDDAVIRHGVLQAEVAFLQKPFTPKALAHKVRLLLDGPG